jgi:hypothetical protein
MLARYTKTWRRIIAASAFTSAGALVLIVFGVHWQLYGWIMGEPFWQGRPLSYWRHELDGFAILVSDFGSNGQSCYLLPDDDNCGLSWNDRLPLGGYRVDYVWPSGSFMKERVARVARCVGLRWRPDSHEPAKFGNDPRSFPLLVALLSDPLPKIRGFAANELGQIAICHPEFSPNITGILHAAASDTAELPRPTEIIDDWAAGQNAALAAGKKLPSRLRKMTVGDVAANSLFRIKVGGP